MSKEDAELEQLIEEEPFDNLKMKIASFKSRIMAMMLDGSLSWDRGCALRNYIDALYKDKSR